MEDNLDFDFDKSNRENEREWAAEEYADFKIDEDRMIRHEDELRLMSFIDKEFQENPENAHEIASFLLRIAKYLNSNLMHEEYKKIRAELKQSI
jgi:hypothetical protein